MGDNGLRWRCPDDRAYHPEHLWVRREGAEVVVGVTDYLQDTAGAILYVQLPAPGTRVAAGEPLFSLEAAKWVGHFPAPAAGEVVAVNPGVQAQPGLVNRDCYGSGWLVRLAPAGPEQGLLTAAAYARLLAEEAAEPGVAAGDARGGGAHR